MDDYMLSLVESLTPSNGTSNLSLEVQGTNSLLQAFRASPDIIAREAKPFNIMFLIIEQFSVVVQSFLTSHNRVQ